MNNSNANPAVVWWREWRDRTPLVTKACCAGLTLIGLCALILGKNLPLLMGNFTQFSILQYQVYRIFLSSFAMVDILDWFFCLYAFSSIGSRAELAIGSISMVIMMAVLSTATNILFNLLVLILAFNPLYPLPALLLYPCTSFWSIIFGLVVQECMHSPEAPRQIWILPIVVQSKYFPLLWLLFWSLIFGPQVSPLIAVAAGYLYSYGAFQWTVPSTVRLQRWERGCLKRLTNLPGFVESSACLGFEIILPTMYQQYERFPSQYYTAEPAPRYVPPVRAQPAFVMAPPSSPPRSFQAPVTTGTRDGVMHAPKLDRSSIRETLAAAAEARIKPPAADTPGLSLKN